MALGTVQRQYAAGPLRIANWANVINAHVFPGPAIITALKGSAEGFIKSSNHRVTTEITASDADAQDNDAPMKRADRAGSIVSTTTIETRIEPSMPRAESFDVDGLADALEDLGEPPIDRGLLLLAEMSSEGNLLVGDYTAKCVAMAREHRDYVLGFIAQKSLNSHPQDNFITFTPGVRLGSANGDGLGQQYNTPREVVLRSGADVIIVGRGILGATNRVTEAERYRKEAWKAYQERVN